MKKESSSNFRQNIGIIAGLLLFFIILLLPPLEGLKPEGQRMAAVAALMAVWWVTEAIPIPAPALIPLALFPLLKILPSKAVAPNYTNHLIFLFIGGFLLAAAIQKWNLHKRIALNIIRIVGTNPYNLILGFMIATGFLAMWISNTATAMMMLPIAMAVVNQLATSSSYQGKTGPEIHALTKSNFGSALMLGIAYSASIGGIGTLIGTPPNIVFAGFIKELYPNAPEVGFLQWMLMGVPIVVIFLPICWFVLCRFSTQLPLKDFSFGDSSNNEVINNSIKELGPMSKGERIVALTFLATVLLWMFRKSIKLDFMTIPGWTSIFDPAHAKYFHDATVAIFIAVFMFLCPVNLKKRQFLLDWESAMKTIPWGIVLLFGGGFAMAAGFKGTGLDAWLGGILGHLGGIPMLVMIFAICIFMTFFTEVTSNTATTTMMMPILAATAVGLGQHPFFLMIPATLSASCAFMLPVATPPNAIVFGSGWVKMPQMARTGLILNLSGVVFITFIAYLALIFLFGVQVGQLPVWIN